MTGGALPLPAPLAHRAGLMTGIGCALAVAATLWGQVRLGLPAVAGVLAAAGAATLVFAPRVAIVLLLVVTTTLLGSRTGGIALAGVRSDAAEMLALGLLGAWAVRVALGDHTRWSRFSGPLLLVALAAGFGAVVATLDGATRTEVLGPLKSFIFWLLPLPLAGLLHDRRGLDWLENAVVRLAVAGSVALLVMMAAGLPLPSADDEVVTLGTTVAAARLRPALLQLLFLATLLVVHRLATRGRTPAAVACLVLFLVVQGLSFTRSAWVALAVAALAYLRLRPGRRNPVAALRRSTAIGLGGLALFVAAASGSLGATPQAMAVRVQSVVDPAVLSERSLTDRGDENQAAWRTLQDRPVTGVGLARPYGARRAVWSADVGGLVWHDRTFIHNSVLAIWLNLGLLGLAAFGALGLAVVRTARWARQHVDPVTASRALAAALAVAGIAVQALVQTKLYHRPSIVVVAVALVLLDVPRERQA